MLRIALVSVLVGLFVCFSLDTLDGAPTGEVCPLRGTSLNISENTALELCILDNKMVAYLVDGDFRLTKLPVSSITIIVSDPGHRQNKWRTVLTENAPSCFSSPRLFHGPNNFRADIIVQFKDRPTVSFFRKQVNLDPKN